MFDVLTTFGVAALIGTNKDKLIFRYVVLTCTAIIFALYVYQNHIIMGVDYGN